MSTPSSSTSGNIIPRRSPGCRLPVRSAIMFMPNSPSPPSGITVRDFDCLLALLNGIFLHPQTSNAITLLTAAAPLALPLTIRLEQL